MLLVKLFLIIGMNIFYTSSKAVCLLPPSVKELFSIVFQASFRFCMNRIDSIRINIKLMNSIQFMLS